MKHSDTYTDHPRRKTILSHSWFDKYLPVMSWDASNPPETLLQRPSFGINGGECWAVGGLQAYIVIQLAHRINVTAVSYEHLPRELSHSGNMDSAPKVFTVFVSLLF